MRNWPDEARGIVLGKVLPEATLYGTREIRVTSCTADWRTCRPGDLFVALGDAEANVEHQIEQAISRGAVAVVAQRLSGPLAVPYCLVSDIHQALGRICQALAGFPSEKLNVVGITGSSGKTTTSHLIASVLAAGDFPTGLLGSLGFCDGVKSSPPPRCTPTAPMLATWLGRSMANGCTHVVMEISASSLEQSKIAGISLDIACLTNVLDDCISEASDPMAKIFEQLPPEGIAVLNADDPRSREVLSRVDTPALTVGIESPAEISATIVEQTLNDQTFLLSAGSETIPVRTPLVGTQNIYNCLFAAAVGFGYGMDPAAIVRGLESVQCVPGQLERLECGQPFGVFVDDACNRMQFEAALRTLRQHTRGRLLCAYGAGAWQNEFERARLGQLADRLADVSIISHCALPSGDSTAAQDSKVETPPHLRMNSPIRAITDRTEAIRWVLRHASPGDCVLIAGGANGEDTGRHSTWRLDDREVAKQVLYEGVPAHDFHRAAA